MVEGLQLFNDLLKFLNTLPPNSADWQAIEQAVGKPGLPPPEQVIQQLSEIFKLDAAEKSS